ncbi:hypothetical protein QOT17_005055 [Balamuthia mandrillaris]
MKRASLNSAFPSLFVFVMLMTTTTPMAESVSLPACPFGTSYTERFHTCSSFCLSFLDTPQQTPSSYIPLCECVTNYFWPCLGCVNISFSFDSWSVDAETEELLRRVSACSSCPGAIPEDYFDLCFYDLPILEWDVYDQCNYYNETSGETAVTGFVAEMNHQGSEVLACECSEGWAGPRCQYQRTEENCELWDEPTRSYTGGCVSPEHSDISCPSEQKPYLCDERNGVCVANEDFCPTGSGDIAIDGSTSQQDGDTFIDGGDEYWNGCPVHKPDRCTNGTCVANASQECLQCSYLSPSSSSSYSSSATSPPVMEEKEGTRCWDGSCAASGHQCSAPPIDTKPTPQVIPIPSHQLEPLYITIMSASSSSSFPLGHVIVEPYTFFSEAEEDESRLILSVDAVADSEMVQLVGEEVVHEVFSTIVSLEVRDNVTGELFHGPFLRPIFLSLRVLNLPIFVNDLTETQLAFVDEEQNEWKRLPSAVVVSTTNGEEEISTLTDHFTKFAVLFGHSELSSEQQSGGDEEDSPLLNEAKAGIIAGCLAAVVLLLVIISAVTLRARHRFLLRRKKQPSPQQAPPPSSQQQHPFAAEEGKEKSPPDARARSSSSSLFDDQIIDVEDGRGTNSKKKNTLTFQHIQTLVD